MNRTAYIFVPGIYNRPGNPHAATDRAVTWVHVNRPGAVAEKYEYAAGVLTRHVSNKRLAQSLAALVDSYPIDRFSVVLVAHSNGCEVARRALMLSERPANWVHFFAPAVDSNPRKHKLHKLLENGQIGFLRLHVAALDRVLAHRYLGGMPAAKVAAQFAEERHTHVAEHDCGHVGFFSTENFEDTMVRICGPGQEATQ